MHKKHFSALYFASVVSLGASWSAQAAITGLFNVISSFMVQFVFPWELSHLGSAAIFFIYSGLGLAALILLGWLLPETKGKSLEELELVLGNRT